MAFVIADRVKETSTTTGAGALTLAGAMTGFQTFAAKCAVGDTLYYALQGVDANGTPTGEWECGLGTYSAASTLTRTTITSSSNAGSVVTLSAGTKQVYITMPAVQAAWPRERLTAGRTYYVRTDGVDTNIGLENTAGGAFLTIQKAVNVVALLDIATYDVTIQLADGTYTGNVVVNNPWLGSGTVKLLGNATTRANVLVTASTGNTIIAQNGAALICQSFKVTSTAGVGLQAKINGSITYANIDFGACAVGQVLASDNGVISSSGNYGISGAAPYHIRATAGFVRNQGATVTITGTPSFSIAFANAITGGVILLENNTYSGSATGKSYETVTNGVVSSGVTLPGDVAGTTATGGQYV